MHLPYKFSPDLKNAVILVVSVIRISNSSKFWQDSSWQFQVTPFYNGCGVINHFFHLCLNNGIYYLIHLLLAVDVWNCSPDLTRVKFLKFKMAPRNLPIYVSRQIAIVCIIHTGTPFLFNHVYFSIISKLFLQRKHLGFVCVLFS